MATGATGAPESAGTGDYVKAPETVQPQVPVEEQLSQLKVAAKTKMNEFVDKSKQSFQQPQNDPSNKASDERLKQDVETTAQDAANSYNKALNQLGEALHAVQTTGNQAAQQLGIASDETAASAHELSGAAREQAQQKSQDAQLHMQDGKSALQQGVAKVQNALSEGVAVANQKLQEGTYDTTNTNTTATQSKSLQGGAGDSQAPTMLQSLGAVISQTAQSVKAAFVTPSPTTNASAATPTSTNLPVTHPPAQTTSESIGQQAAALKDAVKSTWSTPREAQPSNNVNPGLPEDVPRRATE